MKGGTAALLGALQAGGKTEGLCLLFDVDEEYYFKGMLKFLENYDMHPELAVFPEPGLKVGNGHRGLIEVNLKVRGKTTRLPRSRVGQECHSGGQAVEHLLKQLRRTSTRCWGKPPAI